jgi:methionyl-tRNA formyltransferase
MKGIFLGKSPIEGHCKGIDALSYLIKKKIEIVCVVTTDNNLINFCKENNLKIKNIKDVYSEIESGKIKNLDFSISYGFMERISPILINANKIGCVNFHPAPLPEWRGMGGVFNFAIFEKVKEWGVTSHFIDEDFDTGDIIYSKRYKIDPTTITLNTLIKQSHDELFLLFKKTIDLILSNSIISRTPQLKGRYISRKEFNKLRKINLNESSTIIDNKIKSFWCPPHHGAYIMINNKEYSLVNDQILNKLNNK